MPVCLRCEHDADGHEYNPAIKRKTCGVDGCVCIGLSLPADDPTAEAGLFDVAAPPPVSLADRFTMPPFSTLDRRGGEWQDRKRRWLSMGIKSEVGRDDALTFAKSKGTDFVSQHLLSISDGVSIFDPVICELVYRWFSRPDAAVLDPFAGGSVRGLVAGILGRHYTGVDIREEQVVANRDQARAMLGRFAATPQWVIGDATRLDDTLDWADEYDLVLSCPPYADLEVYSDDPRDISTWSYDDFLAGHAAAITAACDHLREDRYAAWVIGDVRGKDGTYRGLPLATVDAFTKAGLRLLNECVILDPVATAAVRAARPFEANRKLTRTHQTLFVFIKGDVRRAADWAGGA